MRRADGMILRVAALGLAGALAGPPAAVQAEKVEITTYYPTPSSEVTTSKMRKGAVGDDTYWNALDQPAPSGKPVGTFLVQGPVGIGTAAPDAPLDVQGDRALASNPAVVQVIRAQQTAPPSTGLNAAPQKMAVAGYTWEAPPAVLGALGRSEDLGRPTTYRQSGVYGAALPSTGTSTNYAGFFQGTVRVEGTLTANNVPDMRFGYVSVNPQGTSGEVAVPFDPPFVNPPHVVVTPNMNRISGNEAMSFWVTPATRTGFTVHFHGPGSVPWVGGQNSTGALGSNRGFHWIAAEDSDSNAVN